jgi:hypothetical protein
MEEARFSFRPPKPMTKAPGDLGSSKLCDFHGDVRHHTNDCFWLKKRIEAGVKSRKLSHLIKDIKEKQHDQNNKDKDKGKKKECS